MERTAVIDMGSNSFRLVVFGYEPGSWWSLTDEIREPVRISAGMGDTQVLREEPVMRAVHTAAVFASFCRAAGIERVDAVATSAIRDAQNRGEVLKAIKARTGLDVRVLSGEQEAWYGYLAIANSSTIDDGFGIDIGGGSVQLMRIRGRRLEQAESFRLGAVRVSEAFLSGQEASAKKLKALRKHVRKTVGDGWWDAGEAPRLAGIGGTIRNLATAAQKQADFPDVDVQGFLLTADALGQLVDELAGRPAARRGEVRGIKPDRGDVILGGAVVIHELMDVGGFDAIEVAEAGLREGVFFEHLLGDREPPLLENIRVESVENLAHRFHTDERHVEHVARLCLRMYDELSANGLHEARPEERELLWAAALLHDIGMTIDYDDHHRHSHYLILHSGLPGYSPRELVLVALIARYHRKGSPDAGELGALEEPGDQDRLTVLCGIIRLAEQLERSRDQSVADVCLETGDGGVRLETKAAGGDPDTSVAIWSARRNADLLGEALAKPVEVT